MPSELFVSRVGGQTWAVLREDGTTVELRVEGAGKQAGPVGRIVKARVTNVLPGIQSAFLDAGMSRDGFLHVADLVLPGEVAAQTVSEVELEAADEGAPDDGEEDPGEVGTAGLIRRSRLARTASIQDLLKPGDDLLVQVVRDAIESKGARLSCYITLPGRYLVYLPQISHRGISRRIRDFEERARLRSILNRLPPPPGGFVVRTAGRGVEESAFLADAILLLETWGQIVSRAERATAPAVVHEDLGLLLRLLRDAPREGLERIVVDHPEARERALSYLRPLDPTLATRIRLHVGPPSLLEAHGLDQEIERALRPKVWLNSGGHLVIEQTEALVSIDVNTGRFVGKRGLEETVLRTNLEAAQEIPRQLRLRDLGGIIVVDFIDMPRPESRRKVIQALETGLRKDSARTKIVGLSELGLLQLTRKRTRPGLAAQLTRRCPVCSGHGRIKTPETVAAEAMTEVQRVLPVLDGQAVSVRAHPDVARALRLALQSDEPWGGAVGQVEVQVEEDPSALPDRFDVRAW